MKQELKRKDLIYPELSYQIIGILFEVFKQLGSGYQEKYYQRALSLEFQKSNLKFREQVPVTLVYKNQRIGRYYLDFLIDDKVILEIKKHKNFSRKNIDQVYGYLRALNLKLGLIANFTKDGVQFKRILNVV